MTPRGGADMVFIVGETCDDHRSRTCTRTWPAGQTSVSVGGGLRSGPGARSGEGTTPASAPGSGPGSGSLPGARSGE